MSKVVFEEYFNKTNGQPFLYNGKEIKMSDRINLLSKRVELQVKFLSTNSIWRQGIVLKTKGKIQFKIDGNIYTNKTVLWEDTAPNKVELIIKSTDMILYIYNVWDFGDGTMQYGHNGGALKVIEIDGAKMYYCNDGQPNDDFTDLIFKIELKY